MNNKTKLIILIVIIVSGIFVYILSINAKKIETGDSLNKLQQDKNIVPQTAKKNIYESNLGFSIVVPDGWIPVDGPDNKFALILDSNKDGIFDEGLINETSYNGKSIFEISNGKFGKYTLRFSKENNCWMVGESNAKSSFGESCGQSVRSFGTKPLFSVFSGNAYVLVNSDTSFIYFDSSSGHTEVLKEIIYSIQ